MVAPRQVLAYLLLPAAPIGTLAQSVNISGIVNTYTQVTAVNNPNNTVTVSDTTGFAIGDRVLLIQMQGALINTTNTALYGDILDYGTAGNYELNYICDIDGNTVTLQNTFAKAYNVSGQVQLIRVPVYSNAVVTGTLLAQTWNGSTGGVIAIEVLSNLTLNANVSVAGRGFQAGPLTNSSLNCQWWNPQIDYVYDPTSGSGAWKGEGIADYVPMLEGGKGKQASGGGGGNDHNSGGGGGGNAGAGGAGGTRSGEGAFGCHGQHPGIGGAGLTYANADNKIFLGGGGGAGHENNGQGAVAGAGGGIVLVLANTIEGNNYTISAAGADAVDSQSDGASGGGAGGTVILDITNWGSTNVNVDAGGGDGGNSSTAGDNHCMGPGGGGGGGVVWISVSSVPGNLVYDVSPGTNGICMSVTNTCPGYMNGSGATPGTGGTTLTQLAIPESNSIYSSCSVLPLEFVTFDAVERDGQVIMNWHVAATNLLRFEVERSTDAMTFARIHSVAATDEVYYSDIDLQPAQGDNYYRVKAIGIGSAPAYSKVVRVYVGDRSWFDLLPTIAPAGSTLMLTAYLADPSEVTWQVVNVLGQVMVSGEVAFVAGSSSTPILSESLAPGNYLLQVKSGAAGGVFPFVVW